MKIFRNSVWLCLNFELLDCCRYRVLDIFPTNDCIILFKVDTDSVAVRPIAISLESFKSGLKNKEITSSEYVLPNFMLQSEDNASTDHIAKRDSNYEIIKPLISDSEFLFNYATKKRFSQLAQYSQQIRVDRKSITRLLTKYWLYGQSIMSLLPAYSNSGGFGKDKTVSNKDLGAPVNPRTLAVERYKKFILTDDIKAKFKLSLKKYYLKETGISLVKTYEQFLRDHFEDELRVSNLEGRPPYIPTIKQFRYWTNKLFSKDEITLKRTSENDYLRNKRGVLGSVIDKSFLPGTTFEIDATVADVHIVSEFGTQYVLGRPTIYMIADRASRMIVGMHVSLFHASWRAARQAIANCFIEKTQYCREFGVNISSPDWPCFHVPRNLMCDNGEMIGLKPKDVVTPMTSLLFGPPYRPETKGVIERSFKIINDDSLHELLGNTRLGTVIRGRRDPRKDACHTLKEVTTIIIKSVLEHNRSILKELGYSSSLLVENDLTPTPANYWKIHLAKQKQDLKLANEDEVIAEILPPAEVSMTRNGIEFNGLYYSCSEVLEKSLASIARTSGRWRLEARIDENTTNYIYVKLEPKGKFLRCELLSRSRMFANKTMIDADFMQDWVEIKKELNPVSIESIDDMKQRKQSKKEAKKRLKASPKIPFSQKRKNIRQKRKDELLSTTNVITSDNRCEAKVITQQSTVAEVVALPIGRARKNRSSNEND
ncbi:transposase [Thalassotalea nanhaiensis]|uniref:Transposase n=1 Tax=Thalassotalea nanhaiensis TaxID=3065648 RepID=A0ABY9TIY8_9GAMM|nr:transposase [Colwelliaceae bacterium SQ345]